MGKIKGWERTIPSKKVRVIDKRKTYNYVSNKGIKLIVIEYPNNNGYGIRAEFDRILILNKSFKTQKEALAYAINYMRSHPFG
jgi:hypothetical protein